MMSLVYVWTGDGAGKTTSALGTALRAVGQGKKVVIVQFLKGRKDIGEYKVKEKLAPLYEIHQFGRPEFVMRLTEEDYELAKQGLKFAEKRLKEKPFLLILDEINVAVHMGLIKAKDLLALLDKAEDTTVYLTGRNAPKEIVKRADFVVELKEIKRKDVDARQGIEF